ncbi:carboxylate-amine ligase [Renibacterium salmoninarum ATCC 33209]|uniref:Putative glutamate--cysteine ligase 2 n=1 Tax=Renibacterium salmoninarum (strain ATCC 33209 / DSM 20767 / JCM 11484 / NBRC 15589 / NCIMB 2235) TaxID=288705 RepID=A9WMT5_RENSM|nr:carboxylate-amine ligase [Renibacterium salmoninarum ATCC 33209]
MDIHFGTSEQSTLGVEWELALVDTTTGELTPKADAILGVINAEHPELQEDEEHPHIKREMLLNTVELVTGVCHTVAEAKADLDRSLQTVREAGRRFHVDLMCSGTHPFSHSQAQAVTDKDRYAKLIDRTQWWGSQMVIFGVHVHVGLDSVHKAMPALDGLVKYFPHFQALSASSPYWNGQDTGYASQRALMFQQLPTAGLPFQFDDWSGYEHYVQDMLTTGVIDQLNEIRWDIRPVPALGTIEMRICDGLSTLEEVGAIAALTQCLVQSFSDILDDGGQIPTMPPWHVQENKWRAARYGL